MALRLLGGPTNNTGSPRLWEDPERGVYLTQGYIVPGTPGQVEIPHMLLKFVRPGTYLGAELRDTGTGSFIVAGATPAPEVLAQMQIPDHETAVEVPVAASRWQW
ncbi:hypothetical protein [Nocardia noduli]|uniref:hypothetical protein n=1 Tax=Nocardia noduli TaxID=2815722 RepID=UPI001C22A6C8|nr:hypothetical protein [Nocardia noduli]